MIETQLQLVCSMWGKVTLGRGEDSGRFAVFHEPRSFCATACTRCTGRALRGTPRRKKGVLGSTANVAQLDINWSYPHFVMFRPSEDGAPEGFGLFEGFAYQGGTYISRRSPRDFFYVTKATRR